VKVPFFRLRFTDVEKKEVLDRLDCGWVTSGPKVRQLEKQICKISGTKYAAAVSSGTAGLHLALATLNLSRGDEVITTPYTMAATIEAILYAGGKPILADINPVTLNIDSSAIEKKISKQTKAIVSVDIAGRPCDYRKIKRLAKEHKLFLLDDAAHSLGAKYDSKPIGSIPDAAVFSFYSTKNITTGEGGMVVSNKKGLIDKIRHLALHGMTSSGWRRYCGGGWSYDITELGYKYNLSDLAAALGVGQMRRFNSMQKKRQRLAHRYIKNLTPLDEFIELPESDNKYSHAWHLFIIKLNLGRWRIGRDRLIDELEKKGVGCGVHFIPIYHFSYFKKNLLYRAVDFPECERTFHRVISLPLYPDLSFGEVDYVCDVIDKLAQQFRN
jgi:dTDP-4-amino-4,6-dideoxygalactose transaminase